MAIEILSPREQEKLRRAGRVAAATLATVAARLAPGITTRAIDQWVRDDTARRGGRPSQLGYKGFPASVCVSRNRVVCHGIPGDEVLCELTPYDLTKGRITYRFMPGRGGPGPGQTG